jgi:uncharacterized repeat protein (TIGR03803 family)
MRPMKFLMSFRLLLAFVVLPAIIAVQRMEAQTFSVIHDFTGGADGANPLNGLLLNSKGLMYGTASAGGAYNSGLVYKVGPKGRETVVYNFKGGADGANPESFLIQDKAGNLYGTTYAGGASNNGAVFKIEGTKETVLYSFGAQSNDGYAPEAGLALDAYGNLYGTTTDGGLYSGGTVFELIPSKSGSWTENILYNFGEGTDGSTPVAGVTLDASGNLYGTTSTGGEYGYGRVFELKKASSWSEAVIHDFENLDDGATPYAGLIPGPAGVFYGAATDGGSAGGGTVFQLTPSEGSWNFSVIESINGWGISGSFRNVMVDSAGTIYATTHCDGVNVAGTVYQLVPANGNWNYTQLYTFTGGDDGLYSFSNLVLRDGKLYGTTKQGGTYGKGVIFEVTP